MHRIIKLEQKAWLKSYIDMNTDLRKKQKIILKRIFFEVDKLCSFGENDGKYYKTQRYQICNNRKRK